MVQSIQSNPSDVQISLNKMFPRHIKNSRGDIKPFNPDKMVKSLNKETGLDWDECIAVVKEIRITMNSNHFFINMTCSYTGGFLVVGILFIPKIMLQLPSILSPRIITFCLQCFSCNCNIVIGF